jgi:hypothetical protein
MPPTSVLLRRDAFEEAGGFDPRLRHGEDWDLFLRVSRRHRVLAISEILARLHRLGPGPDPAARLGLDRGMWIRLASEIARQPAAIRTAIDVSYARRIGGALCEMGRLAHARRLLLMTWRRHPTALVLPLLVVRTLTGEPVWRWLVARYRAIRSLALRARGRDPLVRRS